jgi:hypothetical protein
MEAGTMRRVRALLLGLVLSVPCSAEGPVFRHKDGKVDQEFEQVYQDLRSKAKVSDLAAYLPLAGGTMTGDINGLQAADTSGQPIRYEQLFISEWATYTATGAWTTNVTYTGKWRRVGDTMEVQFKIACTGAPDSVAPTIAIPSTVLIDTGKLLGTAAGESPINGQILINDAGNAVYSGRTLYATTATVGLRSQDDAVNGTVLNGMSEAAPITFGNGDYIQGFFSVPISGWAAK